MDFGCGGSAGGSGDGDQSGRGTSGNGGIKRKWGDFEATMKAMKDALVKENEEKSAKIRKLIEETVRLKQDNARWEGTVLRLENLPFQEPGTIGPLGARPDPFDVFPPEVWKVIIEKITRYSDLKMLCLAFPQLEQMVKNLKKTHFLFEKVFPLINSKLHPSDIFNCRLVCDKWNQDLGTLLANSLCPNQLSKLNASGRGGGDLSITKPFFPYSGFYFKSFYRFDSPKELQRFLEKMSDHLGNPIFGRFLRFCLDDEGYTKTELDNFWKSALKVVEKFGEHVWSIDIAYDLKCNTVMEFYKPLQQLLVHLPNLRNLEVNCFHEFGPPSETSINIGDQFWKSLLPPLPYLQSVKLALDGETGMVNAFTPYFSNQIHRLDLFWETLGDLNLNLKSLRGLVNLQHLQVELKSKQDILRLLEFPTANLRKLFLCSSRFPAPENPISFNSEQFASLSEKVCRLEHLDLTWCNRELSSLLCSRVRLSGLKTLEIAVGIGEDDIHQNLDFILQLSSLEHLVIVILYVGTHLGRTYERDQNSTLKIRKHMYPVEMLDSNIWTLMPSLLLLECTRERAIDGIFPQEKEIFTREMFENRVGWDGAF